MNNISPGDKTKNTIYGENTSPIYTNKTEYEPNQNNDPFLAYKSKKAAFTDDPTRKEDPFIKYTSTKNINSQQKKKRKFATPILVGISCLCLVCGTILGGFMFSNFDGFSSTEEFTLNQVSTSSSNTSYSVAEVTKLVSDSVVEVLVETETYSNRGQTYVSQSSGSGVIISEDGYIVTNVHVISDTTSITVTLSNKESYTAKVIGGDSDMDIAVLKIDCDNLTPATIGDSDTVVVGKDAIVIGNTLGVLSGTVSAGIISSTNRTLDTGDVIMEGIIQTDASVNSGNSGGGLFNDQGQLIGIIFAKSSGSDVEGIGFAIPINLVVEIVEETINETLS